MATEKYFVFSESGELKRMKGRIVRFLDNEDPSGADKSAIRTSLEVSPDAAGLVQADVGTAPNEIPVNGMLGDMAYQSSDGVSAAKIEVESTTGTATTQALTVTDGTDTNFVVQEDGKVGIGTATITNKLTVEPNDNDGILIDSNNDSRTGYLYFGDASSKTVGAVSYDHYSDSLRFNTAGSQRWTINSTGNLVAGANLGIDFGSTTGGTGTVATNGGLLNDYEFGTFTVTTNGDATGAFASQLGEYTKIGRLVNVRIIFAVNTDFTSNKIGGLPFTVNSLGTGASSVASGSIALTSSATDSPVTCHTNRSATTVSFSVGTSVGIAHAPNTTNSTYRLQFSYHTDD